MVGRPWGQFQGLCKSPRRDTTLLMVLTSSALPIMMELLQALMANIALTLNRCRPCQIVVLANVMQAFLTCQE